MCLICMKNDVFSGRNPTNQERLKARAKKVKELLQEAEANEGKLCYVGDAAITLLKREQYELAKQL